MQVFEIIAETGKPEFVSDLVQALRRTGIAELRFTEPKFKRVDGRAVSYRPKTAVEFDALKHMSASNLRHIGCRLWDDFAGQRHWLYPPEWYDHIPQDYVVVFADGRKEVFEHGVTPRFKEIGALAFGFVQEV